MPTWLALVASYLIGSLDFAVVVSRAHGVDITQTGSGNPGASNVLRTLGKGPAAMVFVGDALKGVIAAALGWWAGGGGDFMSQPIGYAAAFLAVAGHCYPVFHKFRGGRGVATAGGSLLFLLPLLAFPLAALWFLVVKLTKVASIASLTVVVSTIPAAYWMGVRGHSLAWLALTLALIVWRHRPNIVRMISGSEQKVP